MEDSSQEKKHAATGKRLQELRQKGIVLRSRDFSGGLIFIASIMILFSSLAKLKQHLESNFTILFKHIADISDNQTVLFSIAEKIILENFALLLPILFTAVGVALLYPFFFGGWNFSLDVIGFKLEKLNPVTNLKNIFNPKKASIEVLKSMLKCGLVLLVMTYFFICNKADIFSLVHYPPKIAIVESTVIIKSFVVYLSISLIFLMGIDMIIHHYQFQSQHKMTEQEVKDEHKEMEGSVELKRKIRSTQLAILKQRINQAVPKASVVITNPTHYAVALKYDERKDRAPKVIAKGKGLLAHQIRLLAVSHGVTLYEAPPLARAIYHTSKLNAEVRPELYMAIAIVLAYVNQLKNYQNGQGSAPKFVNELNIPQEFIYDD